MKNKEKLLLNGIIVVFALVLIGVTFFFVKPVVKPVVTPVSPLEFDINGSGTIAEELMPELIRRFLDKESIPYVDSRNDLKEHSFLFKRDGREIKIKVNSLLSSEGADDLTQGSSTHCVIAMSSSDQTSLESGGYTKDMIAGDGVCFVMNNDKNNHIANLSTTQLATIYTRESNWKQYGGADINVFPFNHKPGSGTRQTFEEKILPSEKQNTFYTKTFGDSRNPGTKLYNKAHIQGSIAEIFELIENKPGAIGFVSFAELKNLRQYKKIKIIMVNGIAPAQESIKSENYLLARRLYLYTRTNKEADPVQDKLKQDLLKYIKSPAGQNVVENVGFVNRDIGLSNTGLPKLTDDAPKAYRQARGNASKVASNIRFPSNREQEADIKGADDIPRIANFLKSRADDILFVYVFGFADRRGDSQDKQRQSDARAATVQKLLTDELKQKIPMIPVGCSDSCPVDPNAKTDPEREKNRRVEIWVQFKN